MAGEQGPNLSLIDGGGEGGLGPGEIARIEHARAEAEAFADEVEHEWRALQAEEGTPEAGNRTYAENVERADAMLRRKAEDAGEGDRLDDPEGWLDDDREDFYGYY